MMCYSPTYLSAKGIYVPCRKCIACKINKTAEWKNRLMTELPYNEGQARFRYFDLFRRFFTRKWKSCKARAFKIYEGFKKRFTRT